MKRTYLVLGVAGIFFLGLFTGLLFSVLVKQTTVEPTPGQTSGVNHFMQADWEELQLLTASTAYYSNDSFKATYVNREKTDIRINNVTITEAQTPVPNRCILVKVNVLNKTESSTGDLIKPGASFEINADCSAYSNKDGGESYQVQISIEYTEFIDRGITLGNTKTGFINGVVEKGGIDQENAHRAGGWVLGLRVVPEPGYYSDEHFTAWFINTGQKDLKVKSVTAYEISGPMPHKCRTIEVNQRGWTEGGIEAIVNAESDPDSELVIGVDCSDYLDKDNGDPYKMRITIVYTTDWDRVSIEGSETVFIRGHVQPDVVI